MGRFQERKNCLVASSAIPVATASSASEKPDAKNTPPTQKVDSPAMSAVIRFSLRMKSNFTRRSLSASKGPNQYGYPKKHVVVDIRLRRQPEVWKCVCEYMEISRLDQPWKEAAEHYAMGGEKASEDARDDCGAEP